MTPCARNHTVPGEHTPPCTCTRECPDHDGHCPSCRPVQADRGLLCGRCAQRLEGLLGAEEGLAEPGAEIHGLPWAYDALQDAYPSLSQAPSSGGSSIEDAEAERLSSVVSLRADIHDVLAAWAEAIAEQAGLLGGRIIIRPDRKTGRALDPRARMRRRAEWLLAHGDVLHAHPAVAEAWQELADLMSRAHALAPWRPAPTKLEGIPCRCGAVELHDHGDEILCWACRRSLTREEYRVATVVFARRFADDPRAEGVHDRGRLETIKAGFGGRP